MNRQPNIAQILGTALALILGVAGAAICGVVMAVGFVVGGVGMLMILGATELYGRVAR